MKSTADFKRTIAQTSDTGLLTTFAALTHRLHAADLRRDQTLLSQSLRHRRDLVKTEILRRMSA